MIQESQPKIISLKQIYSIVHLIQKLLTFCVALRIHKHKWFCYFGIHEMFILNFLRGHYSKLIWPHYIYDL